MATSRGIDVSNFQGAQDWASRKREGIVFAFAKASEGERTHDARFATHITGIKAAGLVPGGYHFGWPTQDPALEAANYIAAVKPYAGPGFTHWLDLERRSDGKNYAGRSAAQIKAWAAKWLGLVQAAFPGQRVGVYTSGSDLAAGHVPTGTTVWYPAYTWGSTAVTYAKAEAAARPKPSGWTPLFWQFTSTPLDRSICYLSETQLRAWAAGTTPPEDDMTPEQASQLAAIYGATTGIKSLTEKDPKGNPVPHGAGYYLAHIHYDALKINAAEAAQTAAITALAKLAGTGVDTAAVVTAVQTAIADAVVKVDVNVTSPTS